MTRQNVAERQVDADTGVDELQPGTKLLKGQYTITRFLNNGGFGITYLAKDSLNRNVVIKECFPNAFCRRSKTVVAARSRAHQSELRSVVQLFVREAHSLAKLIHPNIVAVHQVFEDNGTAYMAIDYIDGLDLLEIIEDKSKKLKPEEIVVITEKMLSAVGFIHDNDTLHRDISPDNILLKKNGEPVLIDFGAAREQASRKSRALTALRVVKDGYSPQEFYIAGSEQGPWSDLYALGATLYHLISGEAPVNGQARLAALAENRPDPYQPLFGRFAGYPKGYLEAIDKVMNTIPKNRLQSASEWLAMFDEAAPAIVVEPDKLEAAVQQILVESVIEPEPTEAEPEADKGAARFAPIPESEPAPVAESGGKKSQMPVFAGIAAAVVAAGLAFALTGGGDEPVAEPAKAEASAPAAPAPAPEAEVAKTEPAAEPAKTEVAVAEPAPAAVATTPEAPAAEPAPAETAEAAPAVEEPAGGVTAEMPTDPLSAVQVAFAAWDVQMPFVENIRTVKGKPAAVVARVEDTADLAVSGDWIATGVSITAVGGKPIDPNATIAGMMLNQMSVDPDGYARVVVDYQDESGSKRKGLLAVPSFRIVSLENGIDLRTEHTDGKWQTTVQSVGADSTTTLEVGDVIFRDKASGVAVDGPQTMEEIVGAMLENKVGATTFSVIRGSKVVTADMQLAVDTAQ